MLAKTSANLPYLSFLGEGGCTSTGMKAEASANSIIEGFSLTVSSGSDFFDHCKSNLLSASATIFLEPYLQWSFYPYCFAIILHLITLSVLNVLEVRF